MGDKQALCPRCRYFARVKFSEGQEIRKCTNASIGPTEQGIILSNLAIECDFFKDKHPTAHQISHYSIMSMVGGIQPYLIEKRKKKKTGFLNEESDETEIQITKSKVRIDDFDD